MARSLVTGFELPLSWSSLGWVYWSTWMVPLQVQLSIPLHHQFTITGGEVAFEIYRDPASTRTTPSIAPRTVEPGRFEPFARMANAISRPAWSTR